ncbi:hypothetical protein BBO_00582 [Beauveria brongniartii RCEF 3172]|uniref:Uncharacterized protein n=1 Tax=Beauveria brongniartii RCEF 3172 TaxID=1081107 RepID=A0A167L7N3_9HYPO|nr:hypothetical protein BBO_00582 [Beauveria brongniartii RCEF 3172]
MPPPLQKIKARKKAVTLKYGTKTAQQPASTEKDANAEALVLWRRAQALELTNTSLLRANDKLTLSNKELTFDNDKLTRSNDKLTRDNKELTRSNNKLTRSNKDLSRSSSLIAAESAQRRTRIAQLLDELATSRRTHAADHARLLKRAGVIAGDLGRTLRDKRMLRAQLAYDSLESKIHRAAAQVAYQVFEDRHDKDLLLRILKRCRRAYTGSDGPPGPRPPSPAPDTAAAAAAAAATGLVGDFDKADPFVVAEQQGVCTPTRPSRATLITPVSLSPRPVSLTDSDDFVLHTPTRREGLRPRKPYVDPTAVRGKRKPSRGEDGCPMFVLRSPRRPRLIPLLIRNFALV